MKFLKNNVITILGVVFSVWYTFETFATYQERVLFLSVILFFVLGMLLIPGIFLNVIIRKYHFKHVLISQKVAIIIWIISGTLSFFLAGLRLTVIF